MYKPINGWTKQTILNHIESNFKGKSTRRTFNNSSKNVCAYRGDNDAKCAIGLFIPDEEYSPSMEGKYVTAILNEYNIDKFMPLTYGALESFQRIHDESTAEETLSDLIAWIEKNVED